MIPQDWKLAKQPLPKPGPVRADQRMAILKERRPKLTNDDPKMRRVVTHLGKKYGAEYWRKKLHAQRCRASLEYFVKAFWDVIDPGQPLVWNWHLSVICEVLEKVTRGDPEYRRVLINIPPGHTKSRLVSVMWPAWNWLNNPAWRALFVTYVQQLSNRDSTACRDVIESDEYQACIPRVYGDEWREPWTMKDDVNNVQTYSTTLHGFRLATSVSGAGTGFRGDAIVIDDPMNVDEHPTIEALDAITSWYDKRMSSRFNDQEMGAMVVIMQRLHDNDLAGHILAMDKAQANNPDWRPFKHVCLPSEFEPDNASEFDRRTTQGELLFPAKFSKQVIAQAKIVLGNQYDAQHQQRPVSAAGGIFPMRFLRFWIPPGLDYVPAPWFEKDEKGNDVPCVQGELPRTYDLQLQSWDLAFKDLKTSDFVCGQLWARRLTAMYLITQSYGHFGVTRTIEEIKNMSLSYPLATSKIIEDKANGPAVIELLQDQLFGVTAETPFGSKVARAWAVEPYVRAGNVWLPHPRVYPWVQALLKEMRSFPLIKHDDQVDALTQALRNLAMSGLNLIEAMIKD